MGLLLKSWESGPKSSPRFWSWSTAVYEISWISSSHQVINGLLPGHNSAGQVHAPKVGVQCPVVPVRVAFDRNELGYQAAGDPNSYLILT